MIYRFAEYELDGLALTLRKQGAPVAIEPKVFELLERLIRHRRFVVRREVLLREIWAGVAVSEASLCRLVKEARRLIGDSGSEQRLIRTVRGSGYQFVGEIEVLGSPSDPAEVEEASRRIAQARLRLEQAIESGSRDLRTQIETFVQTCQLALDSARTEAS